MRNRDGLKLLDSASFTEDVEGQIARRKLRLGDHEATVRRLLPAIEAAMRTSGFRFEHSGLGGVAAGQIAVVRRKGLLYRIGISPAARWDAPGTPPTLAVDSSWCGIDGAPGNAFRNMVLTDATTADDVDALLAGAAAAFDADRATTR